MDSTHGPNGAEIFDVMQKKHGNLLRRDRTSCFCSAQWSEKFVVVSQVRQRVKKNGKDLLARKCLLSFYHEHADGQEDEEPEDTVDITFSKLRVFDGSKSGRNFCFELKLSKGTLLLSVESSDELTSWTESIQTMTESSRRRTPLHQAAKKNDLYASQKDSESKSLSVSPEKNTASCTPSRSSSEQGEMGEGSKEEAAAMPARSLDSNTISLSVAPESVQIEDVLNGPNSQSVPVELSADAPGGSPKPGSKGNSRTTEKEYQRLEQTKASEEGYMA
eukprot:750504-Hanusia_phi.AAC.2